MTARAYADDVAEAERAKEGWKTEGRKKGSDEGRLAAAGWLAKQIRGMERAPPACARSRNHEPVQSAK